MPEITPETIFHGNSRTDKNLKVQRICANTDKLSSSISFHQYFQEFHMANFRICFGHLVQIVRNDFFFRFFEKIFKTVAQNVAKFTQTSGGFVESGYRLGKFT